MTIEADKEKQKYTPESELDHGFVLPDSIDIGEYDLNPEYAQHPEYPIKFYRNKSDGSGLVTIADSIRIPLPPEAFFPPELARYITPWSEAEKQVMINQSVIDLLVKVAMRYIEGQNAVITGPSAVAKSFVGGWIMSALAGLPYYDVTFGPNSESDEIFGGPALKSKRLKAGNINSFLKDIALRQRLSNETGSELDTLVKEVEWGLENNEDYQSTDGYEWKVDRISKIMGWGEAFITGEVGWQDSDLINALQSGMLICIDEINRTRDQNALTDLVDPSKKMFRIPGRDGRIIKSKGSFVVATQNVTSYAGTEETPRHLESRQNSIVIGPSDLQFYVDVYRFFVYGENPKFVIDGKTYQWKQDVQTDFRGELEELSPKILDKLLVSLAMLQMTLITMVEENKLGKKKRKEGGNYVIDQRDIRNILKSISKRRKGFNASDNWEEIIKAALFEAYVDGISESDKPLVADLIESMPIWNSFGSGVNYDWAQGSAAKVKTRQPGKWSISNAGYDSGAGDREEESQPAEKEIIMDMIEQPDGREIFKRRLTDQCYLLILNLQDSGEIVIEPIYNEQGGEDTKQVKITAKGYFGEKLIDILNGESKKTPSSLNEIFAKSRRGFQG